ncbi:MAG: hypothetical protein Q6373_000545 [Candidatus Sigynarchaeota archaeon]
MRPAIPAAKVAINEMMEYIAAGHIHPKEETREEMAADLKRTKRIFTGETSERRQES